MISDFEFQKFIENFKIIERVREVNVKEALIESSDFEDYKDNPEDFFLETHWEFDYLDTVDSEGYEILAISTNKHVKYIYDLNDIADFIKNDMIGYFDNQNDMIEYFNYQNKTRN